MPDAEPRPTTRPVQRTSDATATHPRYFRTGCGTAPDLSADVAHRRHAGAYARRPSTLAAWELHAELGEIAAASRNTRPSP
jgi:hypothetical protein